MNRTTDGSSDFRNARASLTETHVSEVTEATTWNLTALEAPPFDGDEEEEANPLDSEKLSDSAAG